MGVTSKLLKLYRVDQKLSGLKGRLRTAERYLAHQTGELTTLQSKHDALEAQHRQLQATVHNDETSVKSMDERIEQSRERMNNAATSKEHSALLTEINTIKADRALIEERVLENISAVEAISSEIEEVQAAIEERTKVRALAQTDRDQREEEIKDRLAELEAEREVALQDVPPAALAEYETLQETMGDDEEIMAEVTEENRRNREYTCNNCYTMLPVEQVNVLLNRGGLQKCPACSVILYIADDLREDIQTAAEKKRAKAAKA